MAKVNHISDSTTSRAERSAAINLGEYHRFIVPVYVVFAALGLAYLSLLVRHAGPLPIDLEASHVVQSVHVVWYDLLMRFVGEPGYPPQVYPLVAWIILVLFLTGLKWEAVSEIFATVGIGAVGLVIKMFVDRPRPTPNLVNVLTVLDKGQMSFPAGHVESFLAIFGFLWFLAFIASKNVWVRTITLLFLGELMALIGISRIYTGEHWLTDAIGGYLLGSLWLIATIWFYQWGTPRFFVQRK